MNALDGVCIFGPRVAGVYRGEVAGGAEVQMALLAQALSRKGIRCLVVDPLAAASGGLPPAPGFPAIVSVPGWNSGIRGIRFLTRRVPSLLRTLLSARAAIYYARGFSIISIVPWMVARLCGARFVLAIASDADLLTFRERYRSLYRNRSSLWDWISEILPNELTGGLLQRLPDALLVQHEGQAALAARKRLPAVLSRNIAQDDLLARDGGEVRTKAVLMVGTLSRYKGLEGLPSLVGSLPDVPFEFIGRVTDADGEKARSALSALPNVTLSGALPRRETLRRIAGAKVLLNTSPREGFPNTFLEAWAAGTPVVSLHVDPGGVLVRHGLGVCCNGDRALLAAQLRRPAYGLDPERMRAYVRDYHSGETTVSVIAQLIPKKQRRENIMHESLIHKVTSKEAVIGVVGLGYVGLPLLLCFIEKGFHVLGLDIDERKTEALLRGESYIRHIPGSRIKAAIDSGRLSTTTDFSRSARCDAILIAVPTPLNRNREPDMTYIVTTCESLMPHLRKGQLVVLESTTYPGTTEEVMIPILERGGLKVDKDFYVAFSPEREDPSRTDYTTATIPKVVGATSPQGLAVADAVYSQIVVKTVLVSSTQVAEAAKILENTFRAVNIALVNELKTAFMRMGIDIWEVIAAAKTKPFGFMPFYPGPGLGGHCIPIDPFYLTWKAREFGVPTKFIELAGEVNTAMPDFVVLRVMEVLNDLSRPLRGARILILGIAYKPNVDDDRESPSYYLMEKLEAKGAIVSYNDPYVPLIHRSREHPRYAGKKSVGISNDFDLLLIATGHKDYCTLDYSKLTVPIVDTRNVVPASYPHLHKA